MQIDPALYADNVKTGLKMPVQASDLVIHQPQPGQVLMRIDPALYADNVKTGLNMQAQGSLVIHQPSQIKS